MTPAQRKLTDDELMDAEADMISRIIERCAQVAERYAVNIGEMALTIANDIRKLKDENQ